MTSQISLSKLMKIDIKSRTWLIVLSTAVQLILGPVVGLFSLTTSVGQKAEVLINQTFQVEYAVVGPLIAIVGAILVALVGFRFLFSKRMMDLYGSIPVSRNRMFLAVYIDSVLIYVIPFVCSIVLTSLACIAKDSSLTTLILTKAVKTLIAGIISFLIVYHMCLVAVMLSGHPFVAITNIVLMGLAIIAGYAMIYAMASVYFDTFMHWDFSLYRVAWMSPIAVPFIMNSVFNADIVNVSRTDLVVFMVGSVVTCIANLVLAVCLYNKRKSELAEGGVTNRLYVIIIRSVSAAVIGLYGAMMLTIIDSGVGIVWSIIGVIIGVVASFGIINMILHRTGRAFFKDKFVMIGTLVLTIILTLTFSTDLFHYDTYLPSKESIESANITFPGYCDDGVRFDIVDGKIIDEYDNIKTLSKYTLTNPDRIYEILENGTKTAAEEIKMPVGLFDAVSYDDYYTKYEEVLIKVNLTNGTHYYRRYRVEPEFIAGLDDVINSKEYREADYPVSSGKIRMPDVVSFTKQASEYYEDWSFDDPELIEMIMECYRRDFNENPVLMAWGYENCIECEYVIYEDDMVYYYDVDQDGRFYHTSYVYLNIDEEYVRMNAIQKLIDNTDYQRLQYDNKGVVEYLKEEIQAILDAN